MKSKLIAIIAVFAVLSFGILAASLILPDKRLSETERRSLAQLPKLSADAVFSGEYFEDLEEYMLDQFPARDGFRSVKAVLRLYLFAQSDNNNLYLHDGSLCKQEYKLDEAQLSYAAGKINSVCDRYLSESDVYFSVIPDKNYFSAVPSGHLSWDYDRMLELLLSGTDGDIEYIDIIGKLELSDYYKTDSHWRQERIIDVARALASGMGALDGFVEESEYKEHAFKPFNGVYSGQSALPVASEELIYLSSPLTDSASVTAIDLNGEQPVYAIELFGKLDSYDVFLHGAQSVLTVETNGGSGRELIIFRDSYGSSIAPLLLGSYSRITLVDLRYINAELLGDYVDFENADALFLLSTTVLNSGRILR